MTSTSPSIASIGASHNKPAYQNGEGYDSVASLLAGPRYDVVLLNMSASLAARALRELRQHADYRFNLIYCGQDEDALCEALGDGLVPADPQQLSAEFQSWNERYSQLDEHVLQERAEARLLAWLWLRLPRQVRAVRNPQAAGYYEYPLLAALTGEDRRGSQMVLLQLATQQGYLAEGGLIDRLRLCSNCGSGRLNYIDVCPECQSIAIAREPSLHCFVCGHVGPQERFLKDGALLCPNCMTRLRHIGSDYDRPMENYRCRDCRAFFVDTKVKGRCLDCGEAHAPDELRVFEVRNYTLTDSGRLHCRQGFDAVASEQLNALGLINVGTFRYLLDWLLQLQVRHEEPLFSLLGLRFVNFARALENLGEQQATMLVDSLVDRLLEGMRTTDRCTRTNEECLWLLLPYTGEEGLNTVKGRIAKLEELFASAGAKEIVLRMAGVTAPGGLLEGENAELLMARLTGELD